MIFAYERNLRGEPTPVLFHERKIPNNPRPILASFDVTDRPEFFTADGSPMFGALQAAFPCPAT